MFTYLYFIMVTKLFGFEIGETTKSTIMFSLFMEILLYFLFAVCMLFDYLIKKEEGRYNE